MSGTREGLSRSHWQGYLRRRRGQGSRLSLQHAHAGTASSSQHVGKQSSCRPAGGAGRRQWRSRGRGYITSASSLQGLASPAATTTSSTASRAAIAVFICSRELQGLPRTLQHADRPVRTLAPIGLPPRASCYWFDHNNANKTPWPACARSKCRHTCLCRYSLLTEWHVPPPRENGTRRLCKACETIKKD